MLEFYAPDYRQRILSHDPNPPSVLELMTSLLSKFRFEILVIEGSQAVFEPIFEELRRKSLAQNFQIINSSSEFRAERPFVVVDFGRRECSFEDDSCIHIPSSLLCPEDETGEYEILCERPSHPNFKGLLRWK